MAPRVSAQMFGDRDSQVWDIVFNNIASRFNRQAKERFYSTIACAMFPGQMSDLMWVFADRTSETVGNQQLYQFHISLGNQPTIWFRNLRLLQLRIRLGLQDYYYLKSTPGLIIMAEVKAKLRALAQVVGYDRLYNNNPPPPTLFRPLRHMARMRTRAIIRH